MASLKLEHIYKVYPNGTKAVNDFSLEIKDKEFIVLVGPSGCGKSTTLRMIAGLEEISAGELYIGDTMVNDIEPKDRDIAMVFQNYALYPHMTVYENMAFGLTLRHTPRDVIHEKVMWAAEVLGLKDYLDRKPRAMSGGQRQRVALGRAILRNPKVMLLDEPLSNLDAKLRSQMRSEISKLHLKLQTTFIYVTHDQVEAMTLGTRVVVMKGGRIQQVDSPKNLYDYPANKFVAGFIGTPQMNFINIKLNRSGDNVNVTFLDADKNLNIPFNKLLKVNKNYLDGSKEVILGLRCENISLDPSETNKTNAVDVYVSHFEELGNETLIYAELEEKALGEMDSKTKLIIKADSSRNLKSGDKVTVYFDIDKAHFFDKETERSISPRIPEENTLLCEVTNNKITVAGATYDLPKVYDITSLKGDAIVPINAVSLADKGDFKATITKVEKVDDKYLVYLTSGNAVFFALGTGEEVVGKETYVTFNFAKSTLIDDNGDKYEPLREYDVAYATFTNYRTAISENPSNEVFDANRNARMDVIRKEYDAKLAELNAEYETKVKEVSEIDNAALNASNLEVLAKFNEEYKVKLAESQAHHKAEVTRLKEESKTELETAKNEINAYYAKRIEEENEDYKKILSTNKDKEVIRSRKIEHSIFKENTPKEKQNDLDRKLNAISLEYDTLINAAKNTHNRLVADLKTRRKELIAKIKYQKNYLTSVHKEYAKRIKALEEEKEKAVTIAGLVFFYNVDNHFMIIPEKISNKVIQGLGNKVFTRTYRILVPHDGFILDDRGIEGEVISINDFGQYSYYLVKSLIHDEVTYYYFDASIYKLEVGQKINYIFDFEKTQIFETSLNIRLY